MTWPNNILNFHFLFHNYQMKLAKKERPLSHYTVAYTFPLGKSPKQAIFSFAPYFNIAIILTSPLLLYSTFS